MRTKLTDCCHYLLAIAKYPANNRLLYCNMLLQCEQSEWHFSLLQRRGVAG